MWGGAGGAMVTEAFENEQTLRAWLAGLGCAPSQRSDDSQEEGESGLRVLQQEDTVKKRRETEMLKLHSSLKRER